MLPDNEYRPTHIKQSNENGVKLGLLCIKGFMHKNDKSKSCPRDSLSNEPRHEKTCLRGLRPG